MPNFAQLKRNIIDFLGESEIKVGYLPGPVRMNYPLDSLNALLGTDCTPETIRPVLVAFREHCRAELGELRFKVVEGKYCITVPAEGVAYVHEQFPKSPFLIELVGLAEESHHRPVTIEELEAVFRRASSSAVCRAVADEPEFNYLCYFADGVPDDYRYCVDLRGGHLSYHRLTPHDYAAFGFEA